jgi:hypothetical protein
MTTCPFRGESRGCDRYGCEMWEDGGCVVKRGFIALANISTTNDGTLKLKNLIRSEPSESRISVNSGVIIGD